MSAFRPPRPKARLRMQIEDSSQARRYPTWAIDAINERIVRRALIVVALLGLASSAVTGPMACPQPGQATPATRREAMIWLHGERSVSLRLFHHHTRACWQLQHGCALAFAQMRQQDDFPVGELKRVVMDV